MKIQRDVIPLERTWAEMLYVDLGAADDGEFHGITHLMEHLLVSFDKNRSLEEQAIFNVSAHTGYHSLTFIIKYDYRRISREEILKLMNSIKTTGSICWEMWDSCMKDVLTEIDRRNRTVKLYDFPGLPESIKRLYGYIPGGTVNIVNKLNQEDVRRHIREKYLPASKICISIKHNIFDYSLKLDVKEMKFEKSGAYEFVFDNVVYATLDCAGIDYKPSYRRRCVSLDSPEHVRYLYFGEENSKKIHDILCDRVYFGQAVRRLYKVYMKPGRFHIDYMIQIMTEAMSCGLQIFRVSDVRKILLMNKDRLYGMYLENLCKYRLICGDYAKSDNF